MHLARNSRRVPLFTVIEDRRLFMRRSLAEGQNVLVDSNAYARVASSIFFGPEKRIF